MPEARSPSRLPAPIAYLGGSVTAQRRGAYRPRLHAALCERFGRPHRPVVAGVGGVGAISGLFLADRLVLAHRPGLCFVEFATTDMVGATPRDRLPAVLEALVTRLRGHGCEPCFLLLGRQDMDEGDKAPVLAVYREIAAAQEVMCVDLVAEMSGDASLFRDVVHTTDKGAELIAATVIDAFGSHIPEVGGQRPASATPSFSAVRIEPAQRSELVDPGAASGGMLGDLFDYVRVRPGNGFRVSFEGELVGLVVTVGPTAGGVWVEAVLPGEEPSVEEALLWDWMCHYERLSTLILERPIPAGAEVGIEPMEVTIDYTTAHEPPGDPAAIVQDLRLIAYMVRA